MTEITKREVTLLIAISTVNGLTGIKNKDYCCECVNSLQENTDIETFRDN